MDHGMRQLADIDHHTLRCHA